MRKVRKLVVIYTHPITLTTPQLHTEHHLPTLTTWTWPDLESKDHQKDEQRFVAKITTIWSMTADELGRKREK